MKYTSLRVGSNYRTKIGREWSLVRLSSLRTELNTGKADRDKEVIVTTGAGNQIYRRPGQLKAE